MKLLVEVSVGEVIDKITILQIKRVRITDGDKVANVLKELGSLEDSLEHSGVLTSEVLSVMAELREINEETLGDRGRYSRV